jgi:hypothetical protein
MIFIESRRNLSKNYPITQSNIQKKLLSNSEIVSSKVLSISLSILIISSSVFFSVKVSLI